MTGNSFELNVVMAADVETRKFRVRGRVQGVGFRWFVEREAKTLGISGWVRIPRPIIATADGALLYDSVGGEPLAVRLTAPTKGWQKYE